MRRFLTGRFLPTAAAVVASTLAAAAAGGEEKDYGLPGARHPQPGVLFGGQPAEDQLEALAEDGLSLVLDLRTEEEDRGFDEEAALRRLDVEYVNLPVDRERLTRPATFERFIDAMKKAEGRPTLVHCASGNRVGALYYAYLVAGQGVDREQARARAKENGLRSAALEEAVDRYLDSRSDIE